MFALAIWIAALGGGVRGNCRRFGGGARARYARLVSTRLRPAAPVAAEQARGNPARGPAQGGVRLCGHSRRARRMHAHAQAAGGLDAVAFRVAETEKLPCFAGKRDRKSTRLNSSH